MQAEFSLDSAWIRPGFSLESTWIQTGSGLDLAWMRPWIEPGFNLDSAWIRPQIQVGFNLDSMWIRPRIQPGFDLDLASDFALDLTHFRDYPNSGLPIWNPEILARTYVHSTHERKFVCT